MGPFQEFQKLFCDLFDKPFDNINTWENDRLAKGQAEMEGDHAGAIVGFKTSKDEIIQARVASSFISFEQAELNLKAKLGDDSFDVTNAKSAGIAGMINLEE